MNKMARLNANQARGWLPSALVAVLMIVALAGCGSSDNETSSLTKAQFIRRANAVCVKNTPQDIVGPIDDYIHQHGGSGKDKEELTAEAVQLTMLPHFQAQVDEIRAVGAPAGDKRQVERFLTSMQQAIDSLNQSQKISLLTDIDEAFTRAKLSAQSLGLTSCL